MVQFGENIQVKEAEDSVKDMTKAEYSKEEARTSKKRRYERDLSQRQEEKREFSDVAWSVYSGYFRAAGSCSLLLAVAFLLLLVQCINSFGDWWLREW